MKGRKNIKKYLSIMLPIIFIAFCVLGSFFSPNDPYQAKVMDKFLGASMKYPFGTDEMGRCVFSRILTGGRVTIGIVLLGTLIVGIIGSIIGMSLGKNGATKNILLDSVLNAVTAIPPVAYLIIFIGIWGNSIPTMLVSLTASLVLRMIKLVKTQTEIEMNKAYIMCTISCGASRLRILYGHILPNIIHEIIHFLCLSCAEMIMTISGFSFIGLTLGDNVIDWGSMLSSARNMMGARPMLLLYPVVFIFLSTLSFNMLGKAIEKEEHLNASGK